MCVTLETLELTPEELRGAQDCVRRMAYFKWVDAGRPAENEVEHWLTAESEWIALRYVPHRLPLPGNGSAGDERAAAATAQ